MLFPSAITCENSTDLTSNSDNYHRCFLEPNRLQQQENGALGAVTRGPAHQRSRYELFVAIGPNCLVVIPKATRLSCFFEYFRYFFVKTLSLVSTNLLFIESRPIISSQIFTVASSFNFSDTDYESCVWGANKDPRDVLRLRKACNLTYPSRMTPQYVFPDFTPVVAFNSSDEYPSITISSVAYFISLGLSKYSTLTMRAEVFSSSLVDCEEFTWSTDSQEPTMSSTSMITITLSSPSHTTQNISYIVDNQQSSGIVMPAGWSLSLAYLGLLPYSFNFKPVPGYFAEPVTAGIMSNQPGRWIDIPADQVCEDGRIHLWFSTGHFLGTDDYAAKDMSLVRTSRCYS